jgi:hypothetical protein
VRLAAVYGAGLTIWLFAGYSIIGVFVPDDALARMLYWSNAAQLVFCPLSVYVANLALRRQQATVDKVHELHGKVHDIHAKVEDIHTQITDDSTGGM